MIGNQPSKKKESYKISKGLNNYLQKYGRHVTLPLRYDDLLRFEVSLPVIDRSGKDTLWQTVFYNEWESKELYDALTKIYALLKTDGDEKVLEHLSVARIDFCTFGNTRPFRIRIINRMNDNYDHFYVKRADASRIYGLELEHILSPNRITYFMHSETLIEEHIAGIPGDDFMSKHLETESAFNKIRIAKEFIKFNERCFIRLLGDMRAYNYVVDITPDIEGSQFRIRAIDFDQQSYEGHKSFYLPQYFKENNPIIFAGMNLMKPGSVRQYQLEERTLTYHRIKSAGVQLQDLFKIMVKEKLSTPEKIAQLREELCQHHQNNDFLNCQSMGDIVLTNLSLILHKEFKDAMLETA